VHCSVIRLSRIHWWRLRKQLVELVDTAHVGELEAPTAARSRSIECVKANGE
jgi:hypothetical protein